MARRTSQLLWSEAALISQRFVFHCFSSAPCADLYLRWLWQQLWARLFQAQFSVYISFSVEHAHTIHLSFLLIISLNMLWVWAKVQEQSVQNRPFLLTLSWVLQAIQLWLWHLLSLSTKPVGRWRDRAGSQTTSGGHPNAQDTGRSMRSLCKKTQTCWNCHHFLMMCWEDQWPSTIPANLTRNLKVAMSNRKLSSKHADIFDIRIQVGIRCNWWN